MVLSTSSREGLTKLVTLRDQQELSTSQLGDIKKRLPNNEPLSHHFWKGIEELPSLRSSDIVTLEEHVQHLNEHVASHLKKKTPGPTPPESAAGSSAQQFVGQKRKAHHRLQQHQPRKGEGGIQPAGRDPQHHQCLR
ncbi:unnamed protein product [Ectocarpus sp. CCAP 1310/34]|nr:unnamed protein product [Ectocarpus sp. CCAP 1310/34]